MGQLIERYLTSDLPHTETIHIRLYRHAGNLGSEVSSEAECLNWKAVTDLLVPSHYHLAFGKSRLLHTQQ